MFSKLKYENKLQNNETKENYSERTIRWRVKKAKARYNKEAKVPILINHKHSEEIQVDWKESLKIKSKDGSYFNFNGLGMVLPYSQKQPLWQLIDEHF